MATLWYHTIDLPDGPTPGWMDLRPVVDLLPWPDVRGKRCLDVGTYDGFLAFELEKRGAASVVATDISDHAQWDWPRAMREKGAEFLAAVAGEKGRGFEEARAALGSGVEKVEISVYDLSPDRLGEFDVVVCGSLMLHLKNPVGALEAIRSMCVGGGELLSAEQVDPLLTLLSPGRPATWFRAGHQTQWQIPNAAGHRAMVEAAGFELLATTKPYVVPFGEGYRPEGAAGAGAARGGAPGGAKTRARVRATAHRVLTRSVAKGKGVPHTALRARAT